MKLSISTKIFFFIIFPFLLIFIYLMYTDITGLRDQSIIDNEQKMNQMTWRYSNLFDAEFKRIMQVAKTTADFFEVSNVSDPKKIEEILKKNIESDRIIFGSAVAFDGSAFSAGQRYYSLCIQKIGNEIQTKNLNKSGYRFYDGKHDWWNIPKSRNSDFWSDPYLNDGEGSNLIITYSHPFKKHDKFAGVVTVDIDLTALSELINIQIASDYDFMVVNSNGRYIYHPSLYEVFNENILTYKSALLSEQDAQRLADILQSHSAGTIKFNVANEKDNYWVFFAPITSAGWAFAAALPETEVMKNVDHETNKKLIILLIILIVIVLEIIIGLKIITRPIKKLEEAAFEIGRGNMNVALPIDTDDEIGKLYKTFRIMRNKITDREKKLKESEMNFKLIYNSSPAYQFSTNRANVIENMSNTLVHALGYSGLNELSGMNLLELLALEDKNRAETELLPSLMTKKRIVGEEYHLVKKDSERLEVKFSATVRKDTEDKFTGAYWLVSIKS